MVSKRVLVLSAFVTFLVACDSSPIRVTGDDDESGSGSVSDEGSVNGTGDESGVTDGGTGDGGAVDGGTGDAVSGADDSGTDASGDVTDGTSDGTEVSVTGGNTGSDDGAPVCVDTDPVGDGWGWNGSESCRVGGDGDATVDATGGGSGSDIGSRINLLGLLKLEPNSSEADFSRALFGRLPTALTGEEIQNFYAPTTDTCAVTPVVPNASDEPVLNVFEQRLDLISAGETVVLSSGAGTFATLNSTEGSAGPIYRTDVALNVDLPTGLTADVAGAEFPAFSDAPISDVPALQITNPAAGQNIDAFNFFRWNGNNTTLSVVEIYTSGIGANGEPILVGCTAVDDGSFSFPQDVRAQMGGSFNDDWTAYVRVVYNISRNGDALLVTANSVFGTR